MKQSTSCARVVDHDTSICRGIHVGIVMDGNGRWAKARGMPRRRGHEAGARAVRRAVEAATARGIGTLSLYAFSADNWKRPAREVGALLALFRRYLEQECDRCLAQGIRLSIIGRRDRLPHSLVAAIARVEDATAAGTVMHLRIAIDYSGRDAILAAAAQSDGTSVTRQRFAELLGQAQHGGVAVDVDLLIRTGGERRLSDFMLWECAYAEVCFTARQWPDFSVEDLDAALDEYGHRERRFGGLLSLPAIAG
jgi:undecaprenyl diphosphate synthase